VDKRNRGVETNKRNARGQQKSRKLGKKQRVYGAWFARDGKRGGVKGKREERTGQDISKQPFNGWGGDVQKGGWRRKEQGMGDGKRKDFI